MVEAMGRWGQRWVTTELSLQHLDASLLMWDMRRNLNLEPMPRRRSVIQFLYAEQAAVDRSWWLIVDPDAGKAGAPVDLCSVEPGFDVDLYVAADLRTMTAIWMGLDTVRAALDSQRMLLTGDAGWRRTCSPGWASARSPRRGTMDQACYRRRPSPVLRSARV
jgi:hypothetical protein